MRFLRTNTAVRITVGPFFDKTDGVTPEVALTVTSEKLTLMVDDGNVPTLVLDVAPTASGGANDMVHVTGDDAGFYDLELAAANLNFVGRAMLALTDAATHCPVFHEFMILPAAIYDWLVLGSVVPLPANVTQLLGTAWLTPGVAGTPDVNTKLVGGTSQTAGDLKASISALFTTAMTEAYAADGAAPTPAQALFLIMQALTEFAISGTTITIKKIDGSTTAATLTISDATNPVSATRAT